MVLDKLEIKPTIKGRWWKLGNSGAEMTQRDRSDDIARETGRAFRKANGPFRVLSRRRILQTPV